MFLKKLDMISPPITLYFNGEAQHMSIFSGILTIITFIFIFISAIYYALLFVNRNNPKAYFFNRYIEDAGTFPVNASSMFNFIQVNNKRTNKVVPFDFSVIRAVGLDNAFYDEYMNNPNIISGIDHWIYGYCNNNTDTEGIGYLISFDYYEQSACIRSYYDHSKKQYFKTEEDGFKWPIIEKGCSHPDATYYGIIMQRCDETPEILKSQGPACKSEDEITEEINKIGLKFQLIDQYTDILNYNRPFTKYFYEVTSAITNGVYIINHLNFNPANILTHNGFFFDNQVEERSYYFTQNEKHTVDQSILAEGQTTNGCLIGIYFWMQNTLQYYERNYDRIQDILSSIGGISRVLLTVSSIINLLVHNFIILLDTENLVLNSEEENFKGRESEKKPTILKKADEINNPPRRQNLGRNNYNTNIQQQQSSNYERLMKDGINICKFKNTNNEKNEKYSNLFLKRNNILNNYKSNKPEYQKNIKGYYREGKHINNVSSYYELKDTNSKNMKSKNKMETDKNDWGNKPIKKKNFTWCQYIRYLICCRRNDHKILFYEDFRAKLISEENIIQNYLDIYQLLKINNINKESIFNKMEYL